MAIYLKATAFVGALFVLASCQTETAGVSISEDGFKVRNLPNCGTERVGEFSLYRELPARDEGNGYVGFGTEEQNATGENKQRYSLVNCATRTLVIARATLPVSGASDVSTSLFQRVDDLRQRSRLANEDLYASAMREDGYEVSVNRLPPLGSDLAERADCGCRRFYWETVQTN